MGVNVGQILHQAATSWPARLALVDVGHPSELRREFGFAELDEQACRVASTLASAAIVAGQNVALIGESSAAFVAAWFGIVYAGCAVVPIPILSAPLELCFRIEHAKCRVVFFDAGRESLVREAVAGIEPAPICIELSEAARAGTAQLRYPLDTAPGDTAMILYTSGTTGKPKGAAISHASLTLHTAVLVHHALLLGESDRVLGVLPLTHSYGCRMVMLASFFAGARCVLLPRFDPARALGLVRDEAITWLPAVPTMYTAFAAEPSSPALPSLRWCLCAGAPLADETVRRAEQKLGVQVRQGYGMTEATFCTLNAPPDERVLGSVGKPVWGVEVRVVDEAGNDVEPGQDGEVIVRGHNTMSRYLHDEAATAEVSASGFVHSGDVGRFDAQGRLAIVDRIKDLIIRGGYNIYPAEVEAALAAHPDVHAVAVVGRPDAYYGEEVVAIIVKRAGAELDPKELVRFAEAHVSRSKLPRELAFVDALPLGPSGKVQKRTLRQWLLEGRLAIVRLQKGAERK